MRTPPLRRHELTPKHSRYIHNAYSALEVALGHVSTTDWGLRREHLILRDQSPLAPHTRTPRNYLTVTSYQFQCLWLLLSLCCVATLFSLSINGISLGLDKLRVYYYFSGDPPCFTVLEPNCTRVKCPLLHAISTTSPPAAFGSSCVPRPSVLTLSTQDLNYTT